MENVNKEGTKKVLFFKSPGCPHCPVAEKILMEVIKESNKKVNVEILMTSTARGAKMARKYDIMSVPTTLIIKENGEIIGLRGVRSKDKVKEALFGKEKDKNKKEGKKKGLLRKILGI